MERPTYRHQCAWCVFLGTRGDGRGREDLYLCRRTVVVVRNDDPHDTYGLLATLLEDPVRAACFPSAAEGYHRAKRKGLL
jgi:hypothetical protein